MAAGAPPSERVTFGSRLNGCRELAAKRHDAAIVHFEFATTGYASLGLKDVHPDIDIADIHFSLSQLYGHSNPAALRHEERVRALIKARRSSSQQALLAACELALGRLYSTRGRTTEAVDALSGAHAYYDKGAPSYNAILTLILLGAAYQQTGQTDKAVVLLRRAVAVGSMSAASLAETALLRGGLCEALSALGVVLQKQGNFAEAFSCFDEYQRNY